MNRKPFDVVARLPEPGAVITLGRERRAILTKLFRKPARGFLDILSTILIYDWLSYINC